MELEPKDRLAYALAGNAIVTLQGKTSRFTYKIERAKRLSASITHWVYVLNGSNNESDYRFMGGIHSRGFYKSPKSLLTKEAPSVKAFSWWMRNVESTDVTVLHSGVCGRCGKTLTTPESIRSGLGPTCRGEMRNPDQRKPKREKRGREDDHLRGNDYTDRYDGV